MTRRWCLGVVVLCVLWGTAAWSQNAEPERQRNDLIELLRKKGILSDAEAAQLERSGNLPSPEEIERRSKAGAAPLQVGYDEGFFVGSEDRSLLVKINGRVSSNFFFFEPGTSQNNGQTIDRGRLAVEGTFYKYFRLRLENDFTSSSGLRDAYFAVNYAPELNLQIGQYKVPLSYEELRSKRYVDFVERAAVVNDTVDPSRDIGVMLYGALAERVFQYQIAVMNGAGQNRADNNSDKDLATRLVVAPFASGGPKSLHGLNFGGAFTYGKEASETQKGPDGMPVLVKNSIGGKTETGFEFFPAVPRRGIRWRAGGHAAWFEGPFSLSAEYLQTEEKRVGLGTNGADLPDLDSWGAYAGGTWMLTGETKPPNSRVVPAHPLLGPRNPGTGAWEAAVRYEFFKLQHGPDSAAGSFARNRYDGAVAGLNWYPNEFLRVSLNYLFGTFDERGKDRSPNPSKHSNNAVLARAQLEF